MNCLEIASENSVDEKIREILSAAYEASHSLINNVDNLLKLTDAAADAEHGNGHLTGEAFDLRVTSKYFHSHTQTQY